MVSCKADTFWCSTFEKHTPNTIQPPRNSTSKRTNPVTQIALNHSKVVVGAITDTYTDTDIDTGTTTDTDTDTHKHTDTQTHATRMTLPMNSTMTPGHYSEYDTILRRHLQIPPLQQHTIEYIRPYMATPFFLRSDAENKLCDRRRWGGAV